MEKSPDEAIIQAYKDSEIYQKSKKSKLLIEMEGYCGPWDDREALYCRGCDNEMTDWEGLDEVEYYGMLEDNSMNYCGGTQYCMP